MSSFPLVPMLRRQRELYDVPRSRERFDSYLRMMTGGTDDVVLPVGLFNPMGKAHVRDKLDELIDLRAEEVAAAAAGEAERSLAPLGASCRVALVLVDDAGGGGTHRYLTETGHRFGNRRKGEARRGWAVIPFWTSETPSRESV